MTTESHYRGSNKMRPSRGMDEFCFGSEKHKGLRGEDGIEQHVSPKQWSKGDVAWEEFLVKTAGSKMWSPKDAKVEPGDSVGKGRLGFGMLFVFRGLDWILLDYHVHTWLGLLSGPTSQEPVNCLLSSRRGAPCFL